MGRRSVKRRGELTCGGGNVSNTWVGVRGGRGVGGIKSSTGGCLGEVLLKQRTPPLPKNSCLGSRSSLERGCGCVGRSSFPPKAHSNITNSLDSRSIEHTGSIPKDTAIRQWPPYAGNRVDRLEFQVSFPPVKDAGFSRLSVRVVVFLTKPITTSGGSSIGQFAPGTVGVFLSFAQQHSNPLCGNPRRKTLPSGQRPTPWLPCGGSLTPFPRRHPQTLCRTLRAVTYGDVD